MILALTSTDWLMAENWRQGLFVHCIEEDYAPPLPFNLQDPPGCYSSRDVSECRDNVPETVKREDVMLFVFCCYHFFLAYIKATAALCIITLVTDALATLSTGLGLRTQDHNHKYMYYRIAVLIMMVACEYTTDIHWNDFYTKWNGKTRFC